MDSTMYNKLNFKANKIRDNIEKPEQSSMQVTTKTVTILPETSKGELKQVLALQHSLLKSPILHIFFLGVNALN